ncbi:MAG: winged helix-turn-helix transcriptional regulator [Planctomycetales bacterium]|nr:winged helix-turn-helix transcriptional regulator [Planctomycetales bacterium]NIP69732.1 winged helix-turn-helix transcriptional regulator [Planctomycetales bacterium]
MDRSGETSASQAELLSRVTGGDVELLNQLRRNERLTVSQLAERLNVTATAVRQRLSRLMAAGLIHRQAAPRGRGRPSHEYGLTERGRRQIGGNFADLAMALWREVRRVSAPEVRRGLLERLAGTMAEMYRPQVTGQTVSERMRSIKRLFAERNVPFEVDESGQLPVLTAEACPYPQLAEEDRSVCALERLVFAQLLHRDVRLTACRLDGATCCTFETH